jgi:hypothetical protein
MTMTMSAALALSRFQKSTINFKVGKEVVLVVAAVKGETTW